MRAQDLVTDLSHGALASCYTHRGDSTNNQHPTQSHIPTSAPRRPFCKSEQHLSFKALRHLCGTMHDVLRNLGQERHIEPEGPLCAALHQPVHECNTVFALLHVPHVVVGNLPKTRPTEHREQPLQFDVACRLDKGACLPGGFTT